MQTHSTNGCIHDEPPFQSQYMECVVCAMLSCIPGYYSSGCTAGSTHDATCMRCLNGPDAGLFQWTKGCEYECASGFYMVNGTTCMPFTTVWGNVVSDSSGDQTTHLVHAGTSVGIVFVVVVVISVFVCIEIMKDSRGERRSGGLARQPKKLEAVYEPVWMPSIHISSKVSWSNHTSSASICAFESSLCAKRYV